MTGAGLPPTIPRHTPVPDDGSQRRLDLPDSLGSWVAALALWPAVDEPGYRLVARHLAGDRAPEWPFFSSLLVHTGIATPAQGPDTYSVTDAWLPVFERELEALGGADAVRGQLIEAWSAAPERDLLTPIARWARDLARWDIFERIWLLLGEEAEGLSEEVLRTLRDLPLEARQARPILTWASGAAASLLTSAPRRETEAVVQRLLLDSAMLHADWSLREDTDEAVSAGSFRMSGERRLPSTRPGQSLEAAWRTKQEIDEFIDARSRAGRGPGRTPQAIFRAFSARLALLRSDPLGAVNEARWATILSDWEPVAVMAQGVEALALSLFADEPPARAPEPPEVIDDALGPRGLRGIGQIYELLAGANEALRRLDRDELDRCLRLVTPGIAGLAGLWPVRVSLAGWRAALWGDAEAGLNEMAADVARLSLMGREQEEPLGSVLLGRSRTMLLTRAGAFAAAARAAEELPEPSGLLPSALVHLWSGQYHQAVRIGDAAPYQPGLELVDRYRLSLVRAVAALLDGTADAGLRGDAVRELRRLLGVGALSHVALLPKHGRDLLLEVASPELPAEAAALRTLGQRLDQLSDSGGGGARPLHLTDRESVLLPLLATEESVPEIARKLHVSVNTVRKQVVTLRQKFEADSRAELVRRARTYGAIP